MKFFTLIHIEKGEQSLHNNFVKSFRDQINLYLNCAKQLHRSLLPEGIELVVLTNDANFLNDLNSDSYNIPVVQLSFQSTVPSGIKFYSAHFKLEVFTYLSGLPDDYVALVDSDMLCVGKMPKALETCIRQGLPLYYDITDQVTPAYGADKIIADKEMVGERPSVGLWAGGEFIAGPPQFFKKLMVEIDAIKPTYFNNFSSLHHQGDEVLTSIAIEQLKLKGDVPIVDAGPLSIVGRYWSFVPLHSQKPIEAYKHHFILHLPSDKKFLAALQPDELKEQSFFKKYKHHLLVSRTVETLFKNIKPYAKRLRKKFAL